MFMIKRFKPLIQANKTIPLNLAGIFIDLCSTTADSAYRHNSEMK